MHKNRILLSICALLLIICLCLAAAACADNTRKQQGDTRTVVDLVGREEVVPVHAERIAAMTGPSYEMSFMLGAADRVIMVKSGHTTNYPLALLTNPALADFKTVAANPSSSVNIEDYLKNDVDLVIYYENDTELKKFRSAGIPSVVLTLNTGILGTLEEVQAQSIEDYKNNATKAIRILADVLNDDEAAAEYEAWNEYTRGKIDMIYERTKDLKDEDRPVVYWGNTWGENILASYGINNRWYEIWLGGGQLVGPAAGGGNFPEITMEQLFTWDPDIILVDNHGNYPELVIKDMMKQKENNRWLSLKAVKTDNLHRIPAGVFFIDKGSTTALLLLWLATTLQPELFSDIDIIAEIQYYYKEFYEYDMTPEEAGRVLTGWYDQVSGY